MVKRKDEETGNYTFYIVCGFIGGKLGKNSSSVYSYDLESGKS